MVMQITLRCQSKLRAAAEGAVLLVLQLAFSAGPGSGLVPEFPLRNERLQALGWQFLKQAGVAGRSGFY
jgi:hypothetical protein